MQETLEFLGLKPRICRGFTNEKIYFHIQEPWKRNPHSFSFKIRKLTFLRDYLMRHAHDIQFESAYYRARNVDYYDIIEGENSCHCEGLAQIVNEFLAGDERYLSLVKGICKSHKELITRYNLDKVSLAITAALIECIGAKYSRLEKTIERILTATKILMLNYKKRSICPKIFQNLWRRNRISIDVRGARYDNRQIPTPQHSEESSESYGSTFCELRDEYDGFGRLARIASCNTTFSAISSDMTDFNDF